MTKGESLTVKWKKNHLSLRKSNTLYISCVLFSCTKSKLQQSYQLIKKLIQNNGTEMKKRTYFNNESCPIMDFWPFLLFKSTFSIKA